jgi:hypothetical protein
MLWAALSAVIMSITGSGDDTFAFAVVTSNGKVAKSRRQMVAGGGKYERVIALGDPSSRSAGMSGTTRGPQARAP